MNKQNNKHYKQNNKQHYNQKQQSKQPNYFQQILKEVDCFMYEKNEECLLEIQLENGNWLSDIKVSFELNPSWMLEKIAKLIGNRFSNLNRKELASILQDKLVIKEYKEFNHFCTVTEDQTKYTYLSYREISPAEFQQFIVTGESSIPIQLHSIDDFPAVQKTDGTKVWYKNGIIDREENKPAVISAYGVQQFYQNGVLHRNDLPAEIHPNGTRKWFLNGKLQRENDQPCIISVQKYNNGKVIITSYWYHDFYLHREQNPAIIVEEHSLNNSTKKIIRQDFYQNGYLLLSKSV
jgi:hypothetical protein